MIFLTGLLSKVWGYLAVAGAFVLAIGGAVIAIRRDAVKGAQNAALKREYTDVETSKTIADDVRRLPADAVDQRLSKYYRDK